MAAPSTSTCATGTCSKTAMGSTAEGAHWNTQADRLRGTVQGVVDAMSRGGLGTDKFSSEISDGHKLIDELRQFASTCVSTCDAAACKTKFNSLNDRCGSYSSSLKSKLEGAKLGEPFNSDISRANQELHMQFKACESDIHARGSPTVGEKFSQKMSDIGHKISDTLGMSSDKDNKASTSVSGASTKPVGHSDPAALSTSQYQAKQNYGVTAGPGVTAAPVYPGKTAPSTQATTHPSTSQWSH